MKEAEEWKDRAYKVVRKLKTWEVCIGIFEIDDNKLLVLICWEEQRRLALRFHTEDVSILCLSRNVVSPILSPAMSQT